MTRQKIIRSSLTDISLVNMLQKVQRDEMVLGLPQQVRKENQDGKRDAIPEPFAAQVAPRVGEQHSGDNAGGCADRKSGNQSNEQSDTGRPVRGSLGDREKRVVKQVVGGMQTGDKPLVAVFDERGTPTRG